MIENFVKKYKKHFLKKSARNNSTSSEKKAFYLNSQENKFIKENGKRLRAKSQVVYYATNITDLVI